MEMTSTTASLVKADDLEAEFAAITATISRAEVEEALGSGERPELFLELMRDGDEQYELSVAWDREDLERMLGETDGEAITLMFERDGLERAVDDDLEAHGLRERALVLTVAAATAAAAASSASTAAAAPDPGGVTGAQPVVSVSGHDEAGLAERGIVQPGTHDEATLAARGIESQAASVVHDEASLAERGIVQPGTHDEATLAARGIDPQPVPAIHDEATLVDRGIVELTAVHDEASLAARGIEPQSTPTTDGTGFEVSVQALDGRTAALAGGAMGGVALLITAAAFANRRRTVQPT